MIKKIKLTLFFIIAVTIIIAVAINLYMIFESKKYIYNDIKQIPKANVALVLGTAKYVKKGQINYFYKYRIDAAANLYKNHIIKAILVSGDNSTKFYNEPVRMKRDLIKKGVPASKIYMDFAGFRTLDSIKRAQAIFGLKRYIIVSQKFHLQRAIFIARANGTKAFGYEAKSIKNSEASLKMNIREFFARVKAFLDIYILSTKPKFFGKFEKIYIKENIDDKK